MTTAAHDLIIALATLIRTTEIYPPGNETLLKARERFLGTLANLLEKEGTDYVAMERYHSHFVMNKRLIKPEITTLSLFTHFSLLLERLDIARIEIGFAPSEQEVDRFIAALIHDKKSREDPPQLPGLALASIKLRFGEEAGDEVQEIVQAEHFIDILAKMVVFHTHTMDDLISGEKVDDLLSRRMVQELIDALEIPGKRAMIPLIAFAAEPHIAPHAVSHCILSILFGRHLGLNRIALQDLGISALFAQIGRLLIPDTILAKRGELTEEEQKVLDSIPMRSLQVLLGQKNLTPTGALRLISAYEMRRKGIPDNPYVRILEVIADYESMICHRSYRYGWHPRHALFILLKERGTKYDEATVNAFADFLSPWPPGSPGRLDGKPAVVMNDRFSAVYEENRWRKTRGTPDEMVPLHRFPVNPASAFTGITGSE